MFTTRIIHNRVRDYRKRNDSPVVQTTPSWLSAAVANNRCVRRRLFPQLQCPLALTSFIVASSAELSERIDTRLALQRSAEICSPSYSQHGRSQPGTMGKREREAKGKKPKRKSADVEKPAPASAPADNDYVAYASDDADEPVVLRAEDDSSSDDESSDDGNIPLGPVAARGEDDEDRMSDVDVSFEFFDPVEADSGTIALLMQEFALETRLQAHPLAAAIVAQKTVGTTVKITDEPAPVAFVSCLNVRKHRELLSSLFERLEKVGGSVAELIKYGIAPSVDEDEQSRHRMGLILLERVVNLPPVLVAKLYEALFSEIEWATEDEENERERRAFRFAQFLYVTDGYRAPLAKDTAGEVEADGNAKRRRKENGAGFTFARPEDEAWLGAAKHMVSWPIEGELPGAGGLTRRRVAMVIPASKVASVRSKICEIVGLEEDSPECDNTKAAAAGVGAE
jgi:protein BCP1